MSMPVRSSGPSDIAISALGLGSWNTWDRTDPDTVAAVLRMALDAGVNYFDVAIYGPHLQEPDPNKTEMRFAAAMRQLGVRREEWVFAAKGWLPEARWPEMNPLVEQLQALCSRQHTDHADILVLGDLMEPREDFGDLLGQIETVLRQGLARAWAVNNWAASEVATITEQAQALGIPGPDFAQHKYGLVRRSVPEGRPYRELFERFGTRVQATDTFEGGMLFGPRPTSEQGPTPRFIAADVGGVKERLASALPQIREAAASLGATPAQLAIAVPLLNATTANVVIGSRTIEQTRENLGVASLLERKSAAEILAAAAPFHFDKDAIDESAGWGRYPGDDPETYLVRER